MYNVVVKTTNGDYRTFANSRYDVSNISVSLNESRPECFINISDDLIVRAGDVIVLYVDGEKEESK